MNQRESVLVIAREKLDVGFIHASLGGAVPKSTIRAILSDATARGEISGEWRVRATKLRPVQIHTDHFRCTLPDDVRAAIDLAADDRDMTPVELVTKVMTTVFRENLIEAVLDDGAAE